MSTSQRSLEHSNSRAPFLISWNVENVSGEVSTSDDGRRDEMWGGWDLQEALDVTHV